jgi:hypothetical protein
MEEMKIFEHEGLYHYYWDFKITIKKGKVVPVLN